jgi:sigma-B regulation protein RsbU (phosphoserine phosphatase)
MELALEEAIVNIVNYAYPSSSGPLEITCEYTAGEQLLFILKDKGKAFNPLTHHAEPIHTDHIEELVPGGFGILIMQKNVDAVHYERIPPYNVLSLRLFPD